MWPLANTSQDHEDVNWDTTAVAIRAVTLQRSLIMEDTTNRPSKESITNPTESKKDQAKRPHTVNSYRNRASHHLPTISAEAETKERRTTPPNQGKSPQPIQQGHNEHKHSTRDWRQNTKVESKNGDKAGRYRKLLTTQKPQDDLSKANPQAPHVR